MYSRRSKNRTYQHGICNRLLQEQKVAVIPGDAFGSCAEGYIRCSYAYSKDIIKKCLEKIAVFVSQFDLK